jgi:class 3 adenylate cyclase/HAMP domain-containing protein
VAVELEEPAPFSFSFGFKLALAMVVIVAVISVFTLLVTQSRVNAVYAESLTSQFEEQARLFFARRDARLSAARDAIADALTNVRLVAAFRAEDYDRFSSDLMFELSEIRERYARPDDREASEALPFFRFLHHERTMVIGARAEAGRVLGMEESDLAANLAPVAQGVDLEKRDEVGYLALGPEKEPQLYEVLVSPLVDDYDGKYLGSLIFGVPILSVSDFTSGGGDSLKHALVLGDFMFSDQIPSAERERIHGRVTESLRLHNRDVGEVSLGGDRHRVLVRPLANGDVFPPAYEVSLFSLVGLERNLNLLRALMVGIAALALLIGIGLSLFAAHHMTRPILDLVEGTHAIQSGDFDFRIPVKSRDEIGLLTQSFNSMGAELELKERYRAVLDKVTDRDVAEELMRGSLDLGGEERETTVLFCDIRGFTSLTEGMRPSEVIGMLNEHMTAMTEVVYEHHGVVDKFGSPRSYGDDALNGARCALEMVRRREALNESGQYQIRIGIGVASGEVVAGCMGSEDRLNYTVLGEKVNLASRLCGAAEPMVVLIDGTTRERLGEQAVLDRRPDLSLKGFAGKMEVHRLVNCD